MSHAFMTDDKLDDIQNVRANPPRVYKDGDALAYATGRTDCQLGYAEHQNPFMMPDNRAAWDRGFRSARAK